VELQRDPYIIISLKVKSNLPVESVNLAGQKIITLVINALDSIENPVEAIKLNIENIAIIIDTEQRTPDISISLIALETYITSEILRKACEEIFTSLENIYAEKLIKSGMNKDKAYELGCVIAAMIEGGITLSLTKKNGNSLRILAKQIPNLINI